MLVIKANSNEKVAHAVIEGRQYHQNITPLNLARNI